MPGGFSFGDYLRCGAIAARSPIGQAVAVHAGRGGYVLGICNGFQVLTEARLLPGALQKNRGLSFICDTAALRIETASTVLTSRCAPGQVLRIPINHFEGNYTCDPDTLARLTAARATAALAAVAAAERKAERARKEAARATAAAIRAAEAAATVASRRATKAKKRAENIVFLFTSAA